MRIHVPGRPGSAAAPDQRPLHTPRASHSGLRTAYRRVTLVRIGVWAALAAGPVALTVACAMPRTVVAAAQPQAIAPGAVRTPDPAGVATLFCELWLRIDAERDSGAAQAVRALAPSVDLPDRSGKPAAQVLEHAVTVRSAQLADGSWSVVVAAQFSVGDAERVVRYFAVPVVASQSASGPGAFTVTAAPAEVAAPSTAPVGESPFDERLPADGPVVKTLGEFFAAYLAGVGEVGRYLSPGTDLTPVRASGYKTVTVEQAAADDERAVDAVPADGTTVRVKAHVAAIDSAGARWPLVYSLAMTARSGRWEVAGLQAGAERAETSKASPAAAARPTAGGEAR